MCNKFYIQFALHLNFKVPHKVKKNYVACKRSIPEGKRTSEYNGK